MSTFQTKTTVVLDRQWVEDLLVTAFDAQYGGCNYWLNEEEDLLQVSVNKSAEGRWESVTLWYRRRKEPLTAFKHGYCLVHLGDPGDGSVARTVTIDAGILSAAWARMVDSHPVRADIVEQFTRSMWTDNLDVDATAADCLVQLALFGEVIFG